MTSTMDWLTVFIDFPAAEYEAGSRFWSQVSGFPLSAPRGEADEFATLVPPDGDAYLRVQRLGEGTTRLHLDVHVADPDAASMTAIDAGAEIVDQTRHGYVVLRSPAGNIFCVVPDLRATPGGQIGFAEPDAPRRGLQVPPAAGWPDGQRSRIAQACFDIPRADYPREVEFWQQFLGGEWRTRGGEDERTTRLPGGAAVELRLQPSMFADQPNGHLHLRTDDREAEVRRLVGLGAAQRARRQTWTLLEAVGGMAMCVLDDLHRIMETN